MRMTLPVRTMGLLCVAVGLAMMLAGAALATDPASVPPVPIAKHVKIFVLTGQSNSLGKTSDPSEKDSTPGEDPLDATIPFFISSLILSLISSLILSLTLSSLLRSLPLPNTHTVDDLDARR